MPTILEEVQHNYKLYSLHYIPLFDFSDYEKQDEELSLPWHLWYVHR